MTPPKLLVVDDEPAIRRLLGTGLARAGYRVVEAGSAREALNALQIDKPDAVLLDLGLPDRDGLELVPLIKAAGPALLCRLGARRDRAEGDGARSRRRRLYHQAVRYRGGARPRPHRAEAPLLADADAAVVRIGEVEIDLTAPARAARGRGSAPDAQGIRLPRRARQASRRVVTHAQLLRSVWAPAMSMTSNICASPQGACAAS